MKILVTAGPTREPVDPVRFISNRSSGKMGYAIAQSAIDCGHQVILVSGPVALAPPAEARLIRVNTACEMLRAVQTDIETCDAIIMAAAVCDCRPRTVSAGKLKKSDIPDTLPLESTPDILKIISRGKNQRVHVGFAAETNNLIAEAKRKLLEKGLDLVVANNVAGPDTGFETDTNRAVLVPAMGPVQELPLMSKAELATRIVAWVETAANAQ